MAYHDEVLASASDARALAALVDERRGMDRLGDAAADALAGVLSGSRVVPDDQMPADRVTMHSIVAYAEEPGGTRRTVTLVLPGRSDPGRGRISILSPVGLALFGRRPGSAVAIEVPGGRVLTLRVLRIVGRALEEAA